MSSNAIGAINPALLAQCPPVEIPPDADSLPIHVSEWGDSGPTVLLVHGGVQGGIGGGPTNFLGQKPLSEKNWKLKMIDRPGFGGSPSRGPDDMMADAKVVAGLLGEGAHLIGHSYGGAVVLLAAAQNPSRVRSLILIEPALQGMLATDPESAESAKVAMDIIVKSLLSARTPGDFAIGFVSSLGSNPDGTDNPIAAGLREDPVRATNLGCSLLRARMEAPAGMRAAADKVAEAKIPVLVISGGYSAGQEITGDAVARMTGGRHVVVEAPHHFVQQANPQDFNEVADKFMRQCETTAK